MAHQKVSKEAVLYFGANLIDKADGVSLSGLKGAACGRCMMFLKDTSECSILIPSRVNPQHGVCGLFIGGSPGTTKDHPPMKLVPKGPAGYYEGPGVPTHCGNCKNFTAPQVCSIVEGWVEEYGCCNAWEQKPKPLERRTRPGGLTAKI